MAFYLTPFATCLQILNDSGNVQPGLLMWTYVAGSSQPTATYTDITGNVPNSNPIQFNSAGRFNNVSVWQQGGLALKIIFSTNAGTVGAPVFGNQIGPTFDAISGINDPANSLAQLSTPSTGYGADLVANAMRSYDLVSSVYAANVPALSGGQSLVIYIEGSANVGDGGGGLFYWSASSTATDDGGISVIKPTAIVGSNPGRYLRVSLQGTFTATLTGFASAPGSGCAYAVDNGLVALNIGPATGTSNATTMTAPAGTVPAGACPFSTISCMIPLEDNGTISNIGMVTIYNDGTMQFGKVVGTAGGFTATGTKGITKNWGISYPINAPANPPFNPVVHTYTTGTSATETFPAGATSLTIEVFGGGGGGGLASGGSAGGGGGAGGYSKTVVSVALSPGGTLTYSVGAGGSVAFNGNASSVSSGSFSITTMTANGGALGATATGGSPGAGGAGGTATGGGTNTTGHAGAAGTTGGPVSGGSGGVATVGIYGSGGGGGHGQGSVANAAAGAVGTVIFAYS